MRPGDRVLDACCGTGDLAIGARVRGGAEVVGLDFSRARCSSARGARRRSSSGSQGDVLALPFDDASFDAATVGFGVRNVADLEAGIRELRRVLRAGRTARHPRDHDAARPRSRRSTASGSTASSRCSARCCPAARPTRTCPRACAASRRRRSSPRCSQRTASRRPLPPLRRAASSRCTSEKRSDDRDRTTTLECDPRRRRARGVPRRARGAARAHGREPSGARRRRRATRRSPPAASGCGRCSSSSRRRRGRSRRSPPASPSSSCTWRRSSTTT